MDILLLVVVITTIIFLTTYTRTLQKFLGLSLLAQRRELLRAELKYLQGFELKVCRIKLKVLDRYFPDG